MLINNQDIINLNAQPIENKNFKKNLEPLSVNCPSDDSSDEFRGIPDIADGGSTELMENYYQKNYYDSNGVNELYKKDLDSKETVVQTIQIDSKGSGKNKRAGILKNDKGISQVILI